MFDLTKNQRKNQIPHQACPGLAATIWEVTYMDTISPEEVARRLEELGYAEEAERMEKIFSEVPLYSQNL